MVARLEGKFAAVFGAGSSGPGWGNGKAAAALFAREGAAVACIDLDLSSAEETRDVILSEGGHAVAFAADVSDAAQVKAAVDGVMTAFGRIDILHNNVGLTEMNTVHEISDEDWLRLFAVNTHGMFYACKHVIPIMLEQKKGVIVNVSTIGSIRVSKAPLAAYNTTKAAVNQLTRTIALQYARQGIRANAVLPGLVDTPMVRRQLLDHYGDNLEALLRKRDENSAMGKSGDAWDVAYAALFLASDEAKYVNGVLLPVDGGITATIP